MIYQRVLRRVLFRLGDGDPEIAHERTLAAMAGLARVTPAITALRRYFGTPTPRTVFGVRFPSAIGLAAGMDKDGAALRAWPAFGFGFVEVGTVTRLPQPGNPRPRLYRLPASEAIVNRMGFNNAGAEALAERLARLGQLPVPLGISIGKSKRTPMEDAVADYLESLRLLDRYADYVAVNVSSPNTPGLRGLQDRAELDQLLGALRKETDKPLLVKIAPDLDENAIADVLAVADQHRIDGLIATNTTVGRDGVHPRDTVLAEHTGGLSGTPLSARAREVVAFVAKETDGRLPIIGVGGINSVDDALRMLDAGASLLQLFTGFIYHGPGLVRALNRTIALRA